MQPSQNQVVATLAEAGNLFTYARAQRWEPEADKYAWCDDPRPHRSGRGEQARILSLAVK